MLNLEGLTQIGLKEGPGQYEIDVTCTAASADCDCNTPHLVRNGTKRVMFFDTPMHGKKVGIWVNRQRFKCTNCKRTVYPEIPHVHDTHRMTDRLYAYICDNGAKRSWTALAQEVGLDPQSISNIWNKWADAELAKITPVTPNWLGIDELYIMGKYRCVLTNVKERTLVTMLGDRELGHLHSYFMGVLDPKQVQVVTMDMYEPYRIAVKNCFPKAKIVVDRFHVMMYASKAVEAARKSYREKINKTKRVGLLGDRWLFLTARENLSALQQATLEAVLEQYPAIKDAYHLKEQFRDVWKFDSRAAAEAALDVWVTRVACSDCADVFKPLLTALGNWREEIFGYMDWKLTNAYTESFNALARRMDNVGRGYSFEALKKRLLMSHGANRRHEPEPFIRSPRLEQRGAAAFISRIVINVEIPPQNSLGFDLSTLADAAAEMPDLS